MMGSRLACICCLKYTQMIIFLLILFASTSILSHVGLMAEGRASSRPTEAAQKGLKEQELAMMAKSQIIGSKPPKCERKCTGCGRCEAVQVPVVPQVHSHRSHSAATSANHAIASSREDDVSDYKPMSWKCKCGDNLFNP